MSDPLQPSHSPDPTTIGQEIQGIQNQTIGQVYGGIVLYLSGGQAIINSATPDRPTAESSPGTKIASNPYKGLLSFHEEDRDNFFGRSQDIQDLWEQFRDLQTAEVRLLPVYGPSGSGKSSLVRAGLIRELGQRLLPGRDRARVAVLVPGTQPLQALATVLARIAENDLTPVKKAREFAEELELKSKVGDYDGLQRISNTLPDIATFPLIVVIDQFEEIYSYEPQGNNPEDREKRQSFVAEREAFIQNLLYAACDRSQYVSVIITMRSDFLGATQQHPRLNKLFSKPGFLVPVMQPEQLAIAITEPAKQVGYEFNQATVQLLVDFTQEQDAALPLLQFALSKIWEGLDKKVSPEDTLKEIGGVGGALAQETQKLYESLTPEQQKTARSIFLALVQTSDDRKYLRRRAPISELVTSHQDETLVRQVINRFTRPGVWILVTSANEQQVEMVEVAHEALIRNWKELKDWLKEQWQALLQKRKIEDAAAEWQKKGKSIDYLLRKQPLHDAIKFMKHIKNSSELYLSQLATNFVEVSIRTERQSIYIDYARFLIVPMIFIATFAHFSVVAYVTSRTDCNPTPFVKQFLWYANKTGNKMNGIYLCKKQLNGIILTNARLDGAKFTDTKLNHARFSERTSLQGADFTNASLIDADFGNSVVWEAIFQDANLQAANLEHASGLEISQVKKAKRLCETILPKDIVEQLSEQEKNLGDRDC